MRRFKPQFHAVMSTAVAYITLVIAKLFTTSSQQRRNHPATVNATVTNAGPVRTRNIPALHALGLAGVLIMGATAFAVRSGPSVQAEVALATTPRHSQKASTTSIAPTSTTTSSTTTSTTSTVPPTTAPPTTTPPTTAPPTTTPPAPVVPASTHGACGGNLPPCCVMMRESRGNPTAVNPSSGASGKWQFMSGTWANYKGYPTAAAAPEAVQDERAAQIWAGGAGASHWGGGCW